MGNTGWDGVSFSFSFFFVEQLTFPSHAFLSHNISFSRFPFPSKEAIFLGEHIAQMAVFDAARLELWLGLLVLAGGLYV